MVLPEVQSCGTGQFGRIRREGLDLVLGLKLGSGLRVKNWITSHDNPKLS